MYPFTYNNNNAYDQIPPPPMPFVNHSDPQTLMNPSSKFQEIITTQPNNDQTWLQIQDLFFNLQYSKRASSSSCSYSSNNELRNESNKTRKKDRHTKINTAQGMRDRRMRLSLDVARDFFDLHDFLGFDKASKTVEWLLIKCNHVIIEIKKSGLTSHECVISTKQPSISKKKSHFKKKKKEKEKKKGRIHVIGQESRKIARERARKRTREKRKASDFNIGGAQILGEQQGAHVAAGNWNPCTDDVCFWKENQDISYENHLVNFQIGDKAWGDCNKLKQMWYKDGEKFDF